MLEGDKRILNLLPATKDTLLDKSSLGLASVNKILTRLRTEKFVYIGEWKLGKRSQRVAVYYAGDKPSIPSPAVKAREAHTKWKYEKALVKQAEEVKARSKIPTSIFNYHETL